MVKNSIYNILNQILKFNSKSNFEPPGDLSFFGASHFITNKKEAPGTGNKIKAQGSALGTNTPPYMRPEGGKRLILNQILNNNSKSNFEP